MACLACQMFIFFFLDLKMWYVYFLFQEREFSLDSLILKVQTHPVHMCKLLTIFH